MEWGWVWEDFSRGRGRGRKGRGCFVRLEGVGEELSCSPFPLIPRGCFALPGLCSLALWLWALFPWFLVLLLAPHHGLTCLPFSVFSSVGTRCPWFWRSVSLTFISSPPSLPLLSLGSFSFSSFSFCFVWKENKNSFTVLLILHINSSKCLSWFPLGTSYVINLPLILIQVLIIHFCEFPFLTNFSFVFRDASSHRLQCRILLLIFCVFYFLCALNLLCDETQFKSHLFLKFSQTFPGRDSSTLLCSFIVFFECLFLELALLRNRFYKFTQLLVLTNVCSYLTSSTVMMWNISITTESSLMPLFTPAAITVYLLSPQFFLFCNFI